ncbi:MAG: helix-turn-helix transcriptional regulator [Halobacteriota archaeon]
MKRGKVIGVLVVFVVLAATVTPVGGASQGAVAQQADVDPDSVQIGVDLQPDGSAQWTIEYRVRLTDENETAAYEDIVADVENNSSAYVDRFATRMNSTVADAESETGRSMDARDFEVSASIQELPQTYGIMTYTFQWDGFAATDGETVRAGDALRGFFLDAETAMMITWPEEYTATTVTPTPTDQRAGSVTWEGPLEFSSGEPLVVVEPSSAVTTTATTQAPGMTDGSTDAMLLLAMVFGVLLALVFIVVWYYRSQETDGEGPSTPTATGPGPDDGPAPPPAEDAEDTPEELLSNEERVTRFLVEHGGRAKQQEIVDGLGWTEAKTSQVLSSMADAESIEKFRIGRENVVKLPEEDDQ